MPSDLPIMRPDSPDTKLPVSPYMFKISILGLDNYGNASGRVGGDMNLECQVNNMGYIVLRRHLLFSLPKFAHKRRLFLEVRESSGCFAVPQLAT
ncbi:unnamed protein product [Protopolystoma xenopodis]|uniref:Uncharacterized protein n=1 Tax=Protopolystoma xenopodis TaxID=117903 RepID=A0A3S5BG97_9PLAT|nr:unnamed protein product [Protopolystoma xenopodis]